MAEGGEPELKADVSAVVLAAYSDLVSPAAKVLGENLAVVARAVGMALAPVEASVWGYEQIKQWLAERLTKRLENAEPDQIVTPPLNVAGPVVTKMLFARDEESLREMYASLLAASVFAPTSSLVHPSFPHIIEQLCPDEAKILGAYWRRLINQERTHFEAKLAYYESEDPTVEEQFEEFSRISDVAFPERSNEYLDNLLRLRVLQLQRFSSVDYRSTVDLDHIDGFEPIVTQTDSTYLELTDYGKQFIMCCCVEKSDT